MKPNVIKIVISNNTFSDAKIENCILKSDKEIMTYAQKIGITKERTDKRRWIDLVQRQ